MLRAGDDVALEGDVLIFLHRSSAKAVRLMGGIQLDMSRVAGTDLFVLQLEMKGWFRALDTFRFDEDGKYGATKVWSGPLAMALHPQADELKGRIVERSIYSKFLGENRKYMVYIPPGTAAGPLPVVFKADGEDCRTYARVLETMILAHRVRPCAIVGLFQGGYKGEPDGPYDVAKDNRIREYQPDTPDPDRFRRHLAFVTREVGPSVIREFGFSGRREDHAVMGFSAGGSFAAGAAFMASDFFGAAMPFSLYVLPLGRPPSNLPRMFFAAGTLEPFNVSTRGLYDEVNVGSNECRLSIYPAGHDRTMWLEAFADYMPRVFPVSNFPWQQRVKEGRQFR